MNTFDNQRRRLGRAITVPLVALAITVPSMILSAGPASATPVQPQMGGASNPGLAAVRLTVPKPHLPRRHPITLRRRR